MGFGRTRDVLLRGQLAAARSSQRQDFDTYLFCWIVMQRNNLVRWFRRHVAGMPHGPLFATAFDLAVKAIERSLERCCAEKPTYAGCVSCPDRTSIVLDRSSVGLGFLHDPKRNLHVSCEAGRIRRRRLCQDDKRHLDEIFIRIQDQVAICSALSTRTASCRTSWCRAAAMARRPGASSSAC